MGQYSRLNPYERTMEYEDDKDLLKKMEPETNARKHRGGIYTAAVRVLGLLTFLGLAITFIALGATNSWNTRLDYNTDFVGRDCIAKSSHKGVCQETSLLRVHAVDMNWWLAAGYTGTFLGLITMMVTLYLVKLGGIYWDVDFMEQEMVRKTISDTVSAEDTSVWRRIYIAGDFLTSESLNGVMLQFSFAQMLFGPFLGVLLFGFCGVRDFHTLGFVFVSYFLLAVILLAAQAQIRRRQHLGEDADIQVKVHGGVNMVSWTLPMLFTIVNLFVWSLLLVYAFKYPHDSRDWSFKLVITLHSIFYAVQNIYFLGYVGSRDVLFHGYNGGETVNPITMISFFAYAPLRLLSGNHIGLFIVATTLLILMTPVLIVFSIFYILTFFCTIFYKWIDTDIEKREFSWVMSGHAFLNFVLNIWVILLALMPLFIFGGRNHDSNVANIKFPTSQLMEY